MISESGKNNSMWAARKRERRDREEVEAEGQWIS
jgi:hypothetical protein